MPLVRTDLAEPTVADRYELRSVLGSGGMGTVWEAYDLRLERLVALKVLRDDLPPSAEQQLEREARAAARITDRRVVTVLDLDRTADGTHYLVMEYHQGVTLAAELVEGPLPPDRLDLLVEDLLGALGAAHRCGVLHRDVKPANVLSGVDGFRVTDFGLASLDDDQSTEGDLMGTLVYVSPERLAGARGTTRSDVFSAAVVLYEAATGVQPFRAGNAADSIARIRSGAAPPLPEHLPAALRIAIANALSPDPAQRPADAQAMLDAVRSAAPDLGADPTIALDATSVLSVPSTPPPPIEQPAPPSSDPDTGDLGTSARQTRPAGPSAMARLAELASQPKVAFVAAAIIMFVALLTIAAIDSSNDPEPITDGSPAPTATIGEPTPEAEAPPAPEPDAPPPEADAPASLDETLDQIAELGR